MATSVRFSPDEMDRLEYLATRLNKSKAQVIRQAIELLYEQELKNSQRTMYDRLVDGGFEPMDLELDVAASDEAGQRKIIREKIAKKHLR